MGREPKHGFVAWLEFKQKVVMKSEGKETHLSKSGGPLPKWLWSFSALCTHFLYRYCKNKAQTPFCPPQHVPPWNWMIGMTDHKIPKLLFAVFYSAVILQFRSWKITTKAGLLYQCTDSPEQGRYWLHLQMHCHVISHSIIATTDLLKNKSSIKTP